MAEMKWLEKELIIEPRPDYPIFRIAIPFDEFSNIVAQLSETYETFTVAMVAEFSSNKSLHDYLINSSWVHPLGTDVRKFYLEIYDAIKNRKATIGLVEGKVSWSDRGVVWVNVTPIPGSGYLYE